MLNLADSVCYCPTLCGDCSRCTGRKRDIRFTGFAGCWRVWPRRGPFLFLDFRGAGSCLQRMILNRRLGEMPTDRQLDLCNCRLQHTCRLSHTSHHPVCPCSKHSNGSYPTLAHNCLGESRGQQSMPGQCSPRVSFKGWSTRENSIDYQTRPDQTGPDQTMALLDCG